MGFLVRGAIFQVATALIRAKKSCQTRSSAAKPLGVIGYSVVWVGLRRVSGRPDRAAGVTVLGYRLLVGRLIQQHREDK